MGLFSKGQKTENKEQKQENLPPSWAQSLLEQGASDAKNLYQKQKKKNLVYQGERVADLSDTSKKAISSLENVAKNYDNSYASQLLGEKTASEKNLNQVASLKDGQNPYFNESLNQSLNKAAQTINSQMSGAGRYGSGANSAILAQTLGTIASDASAKQYNQDVDHMLEANSLIDQAQNNKIDSTNNYYKGQGQALLNMLTGGSVLDKNAQNKLDAEQNKWNETQQSGWDQLNKLLDAGRKSAGNYGTQQSESNQNVHDYDKENQQILKLATNILPLIAKSDRRAKRNIHFYGYKNGYPLYVFRYIQNPNYYLGVIAQDIQKISPEAVLYDPKDGLLMVNYTKIGFAMKRISPIFWPFFSFCNRMFHFFVKN